MKINQNELFCNGNEFVKRALFCIKPNGVRKTECIANLE